MLCFKELTMDRRTVLGLGLGAIAAGLMPGARAEDMNAEGLLATDPRETLRLWPKVPPGGHTLKLKARIVERSPDTAVYHDRYVDTVGTPILTVFRPAHPNGAGIVIAPGGGYGREVLDKEGYETARFLAAAGFTCFILRYRLPGEGWADRQDVPLQDAQRAMRLVRRHAAKFAIDADTLGVMGFSAGGHVASSLVTGFDASVYRPVDAADALSARPAYGCLMYPVVTMGEGCHAGSRDALLGPTPSAELMAAHSCEKRVTDKTPPCFIVYAADDDAVPPAANGLAMFGALMAAKVATELHAFEAGGHGFGIRLAQGKPCAAWPDLFLNWARSHGFAGKA
jgi:acetyl esterase/lipase